MSETATETVVPEGTEAAEVAEPEAQATPEASEVEAKPTLESVGKEAADEATGGDKQERDPETGKFLPKKRKFKIKGKEVEVEYKTEEEELRDLQRGRYMSQEREEVEKARQEFLREKEEVHGLKAQMADLLHTLRTPQGLRQVLKGLQVDEASLYKDGLKDWLQEQQMTPEQRELAELKRWKAEQAELQKKQQQESQKAEMARLEEEQFNLIGQRIHGALKQLGIQPGSQMATEAVKRLAFKMEAAAMRREDVSFEDEILLESLRNDYREEHKSLYGALSGQELFEMLGEEGLKKATEYAASKQKVPGGIQKPGKKPPSQNGVDPEWKKLSVAQRLAMMEKKALEEAAAKGEQ